MNGLSDGVDRAAAMAQALAARPATARVAICPPASLLERISRATKASGVELGGQDCHAESSGAFTGDISAEMLADAGASLVILGHSERRVSHAESDPIVAAKVTAGLRAGLEPIVCVGESLDQREAGEAARVVESQLRGSLPQMLKGRQFTVAYEPVWAIGSGLTATLEDIIAMHSGIRATLVEMFGDEGRRASILYGGSVKPSNAAEILHAPGVGGALVGGASLKAEDFLGIIYAV